MWWAMATGTVHPPAGSDPVILFPLQPALLSSLVVTLVALLYNNAGRASRCPRYWYARWRLSWLRCLTGGLCSWMLYVLILHGLLEYPLREGNLVYAATRQHFQGCCWW